MNPIHPISQHRTHQEVPIEPNFMGKFVRWIQNKEIPTLQKIGAIAVAAFATLTFGFLIGYPLSTFTTVALLSSGWAAHETNKAELELLRANQRAELESKGEADPFAKDFLRKKENPITTDFIIGAFTGNSIGEFSLSEFPSSIELDKLEPGDLTASVMTGVDKETGETFIAMKAHSRGNREDQKVLIGIETKNGLFWYRGVDKKWVVIDQEEILDELKAIKEGRHPTYMIETQT